MSTNNHKSNGYGGVNGNHSVNGTHCEEDPPFIPFSFNASPEAPASLVPITKIQDEHGHSLMYGFRDNEGLDAVLEDMIRKWPYFKRKATLLRSIVHWGVHLLNSGHEVGMNTEAFVDAMDQRLQVVDSMQRAEEAVKKAESRLSYLLDRREFLMCFEFLRDLDRMLESYSLPNGLYEYLWRTLRESVGILRVIGVLEERGFNLDHFKGVERETMVEGQD